MKNKIITILMLTALIGNSQEASESSLQDNKSTVWLGIDYSHVKLIGQFAQFFDAGENGSEEIKEKYFSAWNKLVLNEPKKYDIKGMLKKPNLQYDIEMLMEKNSNMDTKDLESFNTPNYSLEDITSFVSEYDFGNKIGTAITLIAESLNKPSEEALYHFVAIDMATKQILIHQKIKGEPKGFGLRNYWAGSVYSVIKKIKRTYYKQWKDRL